jgi:nucleoside-diphosphate-sugar epimerase
MVIQPFIRNQRPIECKLQSFSAMTKGNDAETLFMAQPSKSGNIKIIRIFNTYGPNMNPADGRVVSNFIVQAC